ncbi:MAG: ABC transporter permease [Kordia sp.]|uniref:ABC transporter permease n=1 Tax=Kordia sp. TaxID=1965332 RepID=UPI00385F26A4
MMLWKISLQNIKTKPLYTFLSIFILGLSIALLLGIQQLKSSFKYQMENNLGDIDLVIGAKGSPLQLVLSSVLHLDNPTGNIPYKEAKRIRKNRLIKRAVPISYGDNYKGYKIVGTTDEFPKMYNAELEKGRFIENSMEVVLGHTVATKLQLTIGDTFLSSHGLIDNNIDVHNEELIVVGILKPTQKVIDRLIITNLESIWDVHDHSDGDSHAHEDHEEKEITSLLVSFRSPTGFLMIPRNINKNTNMQAALPKYELDKLYEYTGVGFKTISWIAYIILVISSIIIFISLYKMVKERSFDLALLRVYGAKKNQLIKIIAYEGFIIVGIAFIVGFALSQIGLYFMVNSMEAGNSQKILQNIPFYELFQVGMLVLGMIIAAILLAIYPITKMNISTILSNEK